MTGKWKWILLCLFAIGTLILGACGGGGSSSGGTTGSGTDPVSMTGQFIDSAVSGLIYQCSSGGSGITNTEGEFTCQVGDTVAFFVGDYSIGSATANKYITPYDLYPENDGAAINVAQLLLTLDSDDDPSNGITIPGVLPDELDNISVPPGHADFVDMATALEGFVSAEGAQSHLESSYENLISTWDYHLDIGDPFYNVFFEENDQGIVEKLIITFELTSDSAAKATFEGTTYNGTWGLIDDLDYGEILNITVTGQDPGYYRLDGIEENRLNVCYADSLDAMDNCDAEFFYFNLADAQAHSNLIGFGPIAIGETWVEYRHDSNEYIGMCHTFTSLSTVDLLSVGMEQAVEVQWEIINGELWLRTTLPGTRGDQKAIDPGPGTDQFDVTRVWYNDDNLTIDDQRINRYWKKMDCPHNQGGDSATIGNIYFNFAPGDVYVTDETNGRGVGEYKDRIYTQTFVSTSTFDGLEYLQVDAVEVYDDGSADDTWSYYVREGNDGEIYYKLDASTPEVLAYEYPLLMGTTWSVDEGSIYTYTVEDVNLNVTVPAGSFTDCVKLSVKLSPENKFIPNDDDNRSGYEWVCPDVGVVKEDFIQRYSELINSTKAN